MQDCKKRTARVAHLDRLTARFSVGVMAIAMLYFAGQLARAVIA